MIQDNWKRFFRLEKRTGGIKLGKCKENEHKFRDYPKCPICNSNEHVGVSTEKEMKWCCVQCNEHWKDEKKEEEYPKCTSCKHYNEGRYSPSCIECVNSSRWEKKEETQKCPKCGSENIIKAVFTPEDILAKENTLKCEDCNFTYFIKDEVPDYEKILRERYKESLKQLEKWIGENSEKLADVLNLMSIPITDSKLGGKVNQVVNDIHQISEDMHRIADTLENFYTAIQQLGIGVLKKDLENLKDRERTVKE